MTQYIRYFIFFLSFFLSITGYARDHITCNLSNSGIPAQTQAGNSYANTYTCNNTNPRTFPAIQLKGTVLGSSAGTSVTGSCATQPLPSGGSCQFILKVIPQTAGTQRFLLQVSVGSLYYINLPEVTTTVSTPPFITWPGSNQGSAEVDSTGSGSGTFVANAFDSSGHRITYTFALSGIGTIIGNQNGSFSLSGIIPSNPGTVIITATADDASPVVGTPIIIRITTIPIITWPGFNQGSAEVDSAGNGTGSFVADATDSSGHLVTYTFALSGAGVVTGNQDGTFTLSGINPNNPGTVTITATADDASPVVGVPIQIKFTNVPFIIWPGSDQGTAQVNSSGVGSGTFVANAFDTSGHPITYTFALTGAGTIIGNQNGTFTLTGINPNNPGSVIVTATANDAAPFVGNPIPISVSSFIPSKTIAFFNNTNEVIYPILEAPPMPVKDPWLQAQFKVTDLGAFPFASTKLYRFYVNGTNGVPPHQSILVNVPFFSELVPNPNGSQPNQFIDWWNAMRIAVYDLNPQFMNQFNRDSANPVTPLTPGPTCISGCTLVNMQANVFSSNVGLPTNDPSQLLEYTFANVLTESGVPLPIDTTHVDYDYSAVDQIYLPVAMEPFGTSLVGFTGTIVDLTTFRNSLNAFISATSWPVYIGIPLPSNPRIPGAYNVIIANNQLTDPTATIALLTNNWNNCLANTNPSPNPNNANCVIVRDLFVENAASCNPQPTPAQLLQNIYGYVSFCASSPVLPSSGPQFAAYTALQHNFLGYAQAFNPYTQLIHQTLQMNVYAYSVDDAVGNINTIGNGIVVAVGGPNGLTNGVQYDPTMITTVGPGNLSGGQIFFDKFGVCSNTATNTLSRGAPFSFQLPASSYPCTITLQDTNNVTYQFIVLTPAPFPNPPTSNFISCNGVVNPAWCAGVNIDFNTHLNIATPPPNV